MKKNPTGKLNKEKLLNQPDTHSGSGGAVLEAELEKELGRSVSAEMDSMTEKEMLTVYENSKTLKGIVAQRLQKLVRKREGEKKKRKLLLVKFGAMAGLTALIILFATVAWFTMSREVGTGGMSMSTSELPFDIATEGANIRNREIINEKRSEYTSGTSGTYSDSNNVSGTYYTGDGLLLRYDTGNSKIGPGGSGQLSLYIIPKTDEAVPVTINFNIVAFAKVEKRDSNGDPIYKKDENNEDLEDENGNKIIDTTIVEITNATEFAAAANAENNTTVASRAQDYVKAAEFLRGHILFYGSKASSEASYYYSVPYTNGSISTTIAANNEGKAVLVPIYWMWTNTIGQITLKKADSKRDGKPIVVDLTDEQIADTTNYPNTDKAKVIKYVKDNKGIILANWESILSAAEMAQTVESETNPEPKTVSEVVDDIIENMESAENFTRLSSCYNAADYAIGTKIAYFMIELTIMAGE